MFQPELNLLPAMYSFSGSPGLTEYDLKNPAAPDHQLRAKDPNSTWELRSLRKHRGRVDEEECGGKKRRLMFEAELGSPQNSGLPYEYNSYSALPEHANAFTPSQSWSVRQDFATPQPLSARSRADADAFCMEVETAQRKLQEIEDRITLEDDNEDLDEEPVQRRPVLVISDSLKKGLQRGISNILPHTVTQSVSHSGMELVLWRPPEDPFRQQLKDSLQKQRKQQTLCRQLPTPCPSPIPDRPRGPPAVTHASLFAFPDTQTPGEEDMEI